MTLGMEAATQIVLLQTEVGNVQEATVLPNLHAILFVKTDL